MIYLVVVPNYWGRGSSIVEAKAKVRDAGFHGPFRKSCTLIKEYPDGANPYVDDIGDIWAKVPGQNIQTPGGSQ